MNSMHDPRPVLDAPMGAVLSALGQISHFMHRAELGNLNDKDYSAYLNSSIIQSTKPTAQKIGLNVSFIAWGRVGC